MLSLYIIFRYFSIQCRIKIYCKYNWKKNSRVDLSSGAANLKLRECRQGGLPSPRPLAVLSSMLAPSSGRLSHPGVETAAHSIRLTAYFLSHSNTGGIFFSNIYNKSPGIVSHCCDCVVYLTINNHCAQGWRGVFWWPGLGSMPPLESGRVASPEPHGMKMDMEWFPKEQGIFTRMRWDKGWKNSKFPVSQLWWHGNKERRNQGWKRKVDAFTIVSYEAE